MAMTCGVRMWVTRSDEGYHDFLTGFVTLRKRESHYPLQFDAIYLPADSGFILTNNT